MSQMWISGAVCVTALLFFTLEWLGGQTTWSSASRLSSDLSKPPGRVVAQSVAWWRVLEPLGAALSFPDLVTPLLSLQPLLEAPVHNAYRSSQSTPLQLLVLGASSSGTGTTCRSVGSLSLVLCLLMMLGLSPAFSSAHLSCFGSPGLASFLPYPCF